MASDVDICNLALARLGERATVVSISPPEGSVQAEHCARFYQVARDALLEMHPWTFATRRVALGLLAAPARGWTYTYAVPTGASRLLAVCASSAASDADTQPFEVQGDAHGARLILSDQPGAHVRFIARVTDATKFSSLFVDALAWLLASHLAGPILKGDAGAHMAQLCYRHFQAVLGHARVADANQGKTRLAHAPAWIAGR